MRERKAKSFPGVRHTLEIINSRTGLPYPKNAKAFGEDWRLVRAVAAGDARWRSPKPGANAKCAACRCQNSSCCRRCPAWRACFFSDTRDTAVTYLAMAGLHRARDRQHHRPQPQDRAGDPGQALFKRNAELASIVGNKLDAYLALRPSGGRDGG